ncbi:signal peptidase I [Lacticaseibacillus jixianensis]|uniref:Signal peptidase I n=1 Tax=Lacticaseibacillus jixianensis TaxID=2486012 RepID=A0ABW4BCA8_9LACO|nr:signal peptidase I [Lacticaseibacillus jixianensis]
MKEKNNGWGRTLLEFIVMLVVVVVAVQLLIRFVVSKDIVSGPSMQTTLENGDRLYSLRHKQPKRDQIVVINAPDDPGALYIKRVIGLPGDTIQFKNDVLYLNGKKTNEPYLDRKFAKQEIASYAAKQGLDASSIKFTNNFSLATWPATKSAKVPKNSYFVMGDNRLISKDSRSFGFVPKSKIQSVVVWRYWPLNHMKIF